MSKSSSSVQPSSSAHSTTAHSTTSATESITSNDAEQNLPPLLSADVATQRKITRLIAQAGQMLLAHGAESALVNELMIRIGIVSGVDEVDVSLTANALVVTTIWRDHCLTTARRFVDKGINLTVISDIQHICIMMEHHLLTHETAQIKLNQMVPKRYPRALLIVMVGLACGAFSRLAGGDAEVFISTFVCGCIGMWLRSEIASRHFNPILNFGVTAFVVTLLSSHGVLWQIGNRPELIMASSVLLLVPGFPFINAIADMLKGYINMGLARFLMVTLLSFSTVLGIVAAMSLVGVWGWS